MKILVFLWGLLGAVIYSQAQNTLTGQFDNYKEGVIYLTYLDQRDSVIVDDGSFSFRYNISDPVEARLLIRGGAMASAFYLEPYDMEVQATLLHGMATYLKDIEGGRFSVYMEELQTIATNAENPEDLKKNLFKKLEEIIIANPAAQYAGMIVSDVIMEPIFSYEEASKLVGLLDQSRQSDSDMQSIRESLEKLQNIRPGTKIEDFTLPTIDGEIVRLSDQKADYLLIEIWGSWCGPCRATNPELKSVYETYSDRGFEILGVAIDRSIKDTKQAVKEDGMVWTNAFAEGMWNNEVVKEKLRVQFVPYNYLLDSEQKIVAMSLSPEELEKKLNELLSK